MTGMKELMRGILVYLLICTQVQPLWAATPQNSGALNHIGIQRVGILSQESEPAYRLLEKRVQRWVENLDAVRVVARPMALALDGEAIRLEEARFELIKATELLKQLVLTGARKTEWSGLVLKMRQSRQKLGLLSTFGPLLQKSLLVEGAYLWKNEQKRKMEEVLHRAISIHPEGIVSGLGEWDGPQFKHFNMLAFEGVLAQMHSRVKRNCAVTVEVLPSRAHLWVNGFDIGEQRSLHLPGNAIHHISADSVGFNPQEELVRCERQSNKRLSLNLEKGKASLKEPTFASVTREAKVRSLILIQSKNDEFKLFLYTPDRAVDELPLQKPIRMADLVGESGESFIPIATDAALALFQKHRFASNGSLGTLVGEHSLMGNAGESRIESKRTSEAWYKSPVFWGILGGLAAGGMITYFAIRPGGPESSDSGALDRTTHR